METHHTRRVRSNENRTKKGQNRARSLFFASLTSLILVVLSIAALRRFSGPTFFRCIEPGAETLVLSVCMVSVMQIFLAARLVPDRYLLFLGGHVVLILLVIWLGTYAISPLGFSTGRIPNLRGFSIIRSGRSSVVQNNEIVSLKAGSAVGIHPLLLDETSECMWISAAGATLDDPSSCDTVYVPPSAEHDVLRVRVRSACGLPDSARWIRISILP